MMPTLEELKKCCLGPGGAAGRAVLFPFRGVSGSEPVDPAFAYMGAPEPLAPSPRLEPRTPRQELALWLHHCAPGGVAGVTGLFRAEQLGPDLRAEAVSAHEQIRSLFAPIDEENRDALVLLETCHLGAEAQRALPHFPQQ